jgi:hypothetical protein
MDELDPDPDPLVIGMDLRIRIRTKCGSPILNLIPVIIFFYIVHISSLSSNKFTFVYLFINVQGRKFN